ncbi:hypothetical protein ACQ4PT_060836 [Festuca glaucescens]
MANHAAAALLIASLLVAVVLADARVAVQVQRDIVGGYAVKAVPALKCNEVHQVQTDDTCSSVAAGAGLTDAQFLGFNPNINCLKVFIGQWVCLDASSA